MKKTTVLFFVFFLVLLVTSFSVRNTIGFQKLLKADNKTNNIHDFITAKDQGNFRLTYIHPFGLAQASVMLYTTNNRYLDLVIACKRKIHYIKNNGDSFSNARTEKVDTANGFGMHDFNLDGWIDFFVAQPNIRGNPDARINNGNGSFTAKILGNETIGNVRSVLFADFDGDGSIDSYHSVSSFRKNHSGSEFHLGNPDGTFQSDIVESILNPPVQDFWYKFADVPGYGLEKWSNKMFKGAVVRDLDGDNKPDLITCTYSDLGYLDDRSYDVQRFAFHWVNSQDRGVFVLHNKSTPGMPSFAEVAKTAIGPNAYGNTSKDWNVYTVIPFDYDNDGDFDLFVGCTVRRGENTRLVALLQNVSKPGDVQFIDVTDDSKLNLFNDLSDTEVQYYNFASGAPLDYNNDGWLDLILINRVDTNKTKSPYPHLFRNNGNGTFTEISPEVSGFINGGGGGRDLNYGDLNNDGLLDVVIHDGTVGGYNGANNTRIYVNHTKNANHWIKLDVIKNSEGSPDIGSKVYVYSSGTDILLGFDEVRTDFSYRSKRPTILHFGTGTTKRVDVKVITPKGTELNLTNLEVDQNHTVKTWN